MNINMPYDMQDGGGVKAFLVRVVRLVHLVLLVRPVNGWA